MTEAISPLLAHVGHWFEAVMFAPAVVLVAFVSIKSLLENRSETRPKEEH
jgi:hypothetical protein